METANERMMKGIVSHQIGLIRVSNGLRMRVLSILAKSEADLRNRVASSSMSLATDDRTPVPLDNVIVGRLAKLQENIKKTRAKAFSPIGQAIRSHMLEIAAGEPKFLTNLIRTVSPVDLPIRAPDANELTKIVTSRPFQGRLLREWTAKIAADERSRIMNEIRIGLTQGSTAREITSTIMGTRSVGRRDGVTQLTRAHLQTLVRTAIAHIGASARREFALANRRLFTKEQWIAVLDGRTSLTCLDLNGKLFDVGKGPHPPAHLNCRSVRVPFIARDEAVRHRIPANDLRRLIREFADKEGLGRVTSRRQLSASNRRKLDSFLRQRIRDQIGAQPRTMTTADFIESLSQEELEDVLGVTRSRLMDRGGLTIGRLVDKEGSPLSLSALAIKEAKAFKKAGLKPDDFD